MKKVKLLALVIAGIMLLSGCNVVDVTDVLSVGDTVVYKSEYNYYLAMAKSEAAQKLQNMGQTITADGDWDALKIGDKTAAEFVKDTASKEVKRVAALVAKGKNEGFVLDEAGKQTITSTKQQLIESAGGVYAYEDFFAELGVSPSDLNTIIERGVYAEAYVAAHPELTEVTEDEINAVYKSDYDFYVKHILVMSAQDTSEDAEPNDEASKQKAQNILNLVKNGADFTKLMKENSEDVNEEGELSAEGYFITDYASFDPAFAEAARKLQVGEYTPELVKSAYGYHIIMRFEPPTSGEDYEHAMEECKILAEEIKLNEKVDEIANELGYKENTKFLKNVKVA